MLSKTVQELTLALLKAWIFFVDNIQSTFSAYDLTVDTSFFNSRFYFHFISFFEIRFSSFEIRYLKFVIRISILELRITFYLYRYVILPFVKS